jgi:hypothetical protein
LIYAQVYVKGKLILRTANTNSSLSRTISSIRLTSYLFERQNNLDAALALYEQNTRLSEAFYTPLQCLEVCFRNTLDIQMSNTYGLDWFHNEAAPLNNDARQAIAYTYAEIQRSRPIQQGDIIAELKFSFWVSLLGPSYDSTLWRKALYRGFQTGSGQKRRDVHGRFNSLRRFRNRVAHHEPIFNRDPTQKYQEIIEAIGWMCRDTRAWTEHHSRVVAVIAAH